MRNTHIGIRPAALNKASESAADLNIAELGAAPPIAASHHSPDPADACAGEMSLQGVATLRDNQCAPQMLVRLVGHRDPDAANRWKRARQPSVTR